MTDGDSTGSCEEPSRVNLEAYLALSGAQADVVGALARLFRSDVPIDPILRAALADALEGKRPSGCPNLIVTDIGRGPDSAAGLRRFRLHVALAEDVELRIREGAKRQDAERYSAAHFGVGEELCHKAVTGYRKMQRWLAARRDDSLFNYPAGITTRVEQAAYLFSVGPLVR